MNERQPQLHHFIIVGADPAGHRLRAVRHRDGRPPSSRRRRAPRAAPGRRCAGQPEPRLTRPQALAQSPRVTIDTPTLSGSLSLTGARLDDLFLKHYHEARRQTSPPVELLRPDGADNAYFARGWVGAEPARPAGRRHALDPRLSRPLSPGHPWSSPTPRRRADLQPRDRGGRQVHVHRHRHGGQQRRRAGDHRALRLGPAAGPAARSKASIVHEGAIGVLGLPARRSSSSKYKDWKKKGEKECSTGGWLGITDKYWMTVFAPASRRPIEARFG